MDIQATKLELLKAILDSENDEFIRRLSEFIRQDKNDFWNELSSEEKEDIRKGIDELYQAKKIPYESFLKKNSFA